MKTAEGMKAMLPDLVFSEIRVEGVAATFLETDEILKEGEAAGLCTITTPGCTSSGSSWPS